MAFGVHVNPLGLTPAHRAERLAQGQLTPASALQFHLPQPGEERLRDVTLLATGLLVTATAITWGYSTPSAFTAAFGTTPGSYRKDLANSASAPV